MSAKDLVEFLNAKMPTNLNWKVESTGDMVFIIDPSLNQSLAVISFFRTPPVIEVLDEGKKHEKTIIDMWEKYLADQEDDDIDTQRDKTMARVIVGIAIGILVICLVGILVALYIGSTIF